MGRGQKLPQKCPLKTQTHLADTCMWNASYVSMHCLASIHHAIHNFKYPGTWHEATESINFKKMEFSSSLYEFFMMPLTMVKGSRKKAKSQFMKGNTPWNKGDSLTAASPSEEFKPQESFRTARMNGGENILPHNQNIHGMVVQELWPTVQEVQSQSDCLHPGQTEKKTRIPKRLRRRDLLKTQQWLKHGTQHLNCLDKIHPTAIHHIWRHQMCKRGVSARKTTLRWAKCLFTTLEFKLYKEIIIWEDEVIKS